MNIAIVGESYKNAMGNFKTCFMTWNLFEDFKNNRKIYSNYKLSFSNNYIKSFKELIEILKTVKDCSIAIDEFHSYFDAYLGVSKNTGTWFIKNFARQTRKSYVKFYYTATVLNDIHPSILRVTDRVYAVKKYHVDGKECLDQFCYDQHFLFVKELKTKIQNVYKVPLKIFELYNSDEIIDIM